MYYFIRLWVVTMALVLTACGGGGGSAGTTTQGGTGTGSTGTTTTTSTITTATLSVTDFTLTSDKATINNSGIDKAVITVTAVDASRNVVSGAEVKVSVDQGAVFTPTTGAVTDSGGKYTGDLTIGGDKTDRDVKVTATANGKQQTIVVKVVGSKLSLAVSPSAPSPGQAVVVTGTLVDSTGNPIPNVPVTLGGDIPGLQNKVLTTSLTGTISTSVTAPTTAGVYNVTASGAGVSAVNYQLGVFSSAVPVAVIPAGASPSLSASPNVLAVNSAGSSTNQSSLRFLFLDSANKPVQFARVRFDDLTTGLAGVGSSIASGSGTLYTDAGGSVTTQYIAGQNSSPTNGVTIRACYSAMDFISTSDCPNSVLMNMTVAGQALAISIGDDNLLTPGPGTYIKKFAVTVADSAGRAVPNAPVDISVDLTHYNKGAFSLGFSTPPSNLLQSSPSSTTVPGSATGRVWCANEDTNRNGNVDPGENVNGSLDGNGQPTLEPRKSDLIVSYNDPAVKTTNASGVLVIKVEYSQRFATWLAYKVRVTANVAGSQGLAERLFVTQFLEGDADNGSFHSPPYGVGSCVDPN